MSAICSCFCSGTATAATAAVTAATDTAASAYADANAIFDKPILCSFQPRRCPVLIAAAGSEGAVQYKSSRMASALVVRASAVDSYESSSDFVKRMEKAWLISQQPRPVACSSCASKGYVECKWCGGTGFFVIGNNLLCEVPSRNTSCVICAGKGSACCSDCKGTGFRAKWLGKLPPL